MSVNPHEIVFVGAVSRDNYFAPGVMPPEPHVYDPGEKAEWDDAIEAHVREEKTHGNVALHWGGNALNTAMGIKATGMYRGIGFVTVRAEEALDDDVSEYLTTRGLTDMSVRSPGHVTSVGAVYRGKDADGNIMDRMIFGRPRTPMQHALSPDYLRAAFAGTRAVVLSSPKSWELTQAVHEAVPDDATLSVNPGSSDFSKHPEKLREIFTDRPPTILSANNKELAQLLGRPETTEADELVDEATDLQLAENVLCTLGLAGVIWSNRGRRFWAPARTIPRESVLDTTGAGDDGHKEALHRYLQQVPHEMIPHYVARSTAKAVQHTGGHGHLGFAA